MKTCPNCGKEFEPTTVQQKYCCKKCCQQYNAKHGEGADIEPFDFTCAKCGRVVHVEGNKDKRSRFCSKECEKKYWRHPPHENPAVRTNFSSIDAYKRWEKKTNEE